MFNNVEKKESSAVIVKSNTRDKKERHEPLIAFLSGPANVVEELFSKAPEKTAFGEQMVNSLAGGAYNEIEKLEPITEKQLQPG